MRKIPIYNTKTFVLTQLIMMVMVVFYIIYTLDICSANLVQGLGILLIIVSFIALFRIQMKDAVLAKMGPILENKRFGNFKINWRLILIFQGINLGLIFLHFYLFNTKKMDLMPLLKEYGFFALMGIVLLFLQIFKWNAQLTDQGIMIKSGIQMQLIPWKDISKLETKENNIIFSFRKYYPVQMLKIPRGDYEHFLKQSITK